MYTVKQLSDLAQISTRTLHYYDEIGLLHPTQVGTNGYRYYSDEALLRLQQILFYREIGLELMQIKEILDNPTFDRLAALRSHRTVLQEKANRLNNLIETVEKTIQHLSGGETMSKKQLFQGFSPEKQQHYERVARLQYGAQIVNESIQRWKNYGTAKQQTIQEEGGQIYLDIAAALEAGHAPTSAAVQELLGRWHQHLYYFYEPNLDILRGLGETYNTHPEFMAFFQQIHADLPAFLAAGITQYVDDLETRELERMIAEDEAQQQVNRLSQ